MVSKSDLLARGRERNPSGRPDPVAVREVMSEAVFFVPEDAPARTVVERTVALNVGHLFVTAAAGSSPGSSPLDALTKLA